MNLGRERYQNVIARRRRFGGGFTLVEVLLAMVIGSLLVTCILGATRALSGSREQVEKRSQRLMEARNGLEKIVTALRNVRRDSVSPDHAVIGENGGAIGGRINLLVVSDERARDEGEESDQYETAFYLWKPPGKTLPSLMCRKDTALDDHPKEGGVATVVADGIVGLTFEYYTGEEWRKEWTEQENTPPKAVRVTLMAVEDESRNSLNRSRPEPMVLSTVVAIHADKKGIQQEEKFPSQNTGNGGPPQ